MDLHDINIPHFHKPGTSAEVASPDRSESDPNFKMDLIEAMEKNLEASKREEEAMGDTEEVARIQQEEKAIETDPEILEKKRAEIEGIT